MIVIPSVDLPRPDSGRVGARDPRDVIRECEWLGFRRIQLVDVGLRSHDFRNRRQSLTLLSELHFDVQVAGDVSSADDVEELSQAGATRVVLGTRALDEPEWLVSIA